MKKPVIVISPQTHEVKGLPFEMKMYATPEKNAWQLQQRGAIPILPSLTRRPVRILPRKNV